MGISNKENLDKFKIKKVIISGEEEHCLFCDGFYHYVHNIENIVEHDNCVIVQYHSNGFILNENHEAVNFPDSYNFDFFNSTIDEVYEELTNNGFTCERKLFSICPGEELISKNYL